MKATIHTLEAKTVHSVLARREKFRSETEAYFRRVEQENPSESIRKIIAWYDSGKASKFAAYRDRQLVESLLLHPKQRLLSALSYWIPIEQDDEDEYAKEYSMLPWLLRIQNHLDSDDLDAALVELNQMKADLGSSVPDNLDVEGDEWIDVTFTE